MRTLTADEVARVRSAHAEGAGWDVLARALTDLDHAAGLLAADDHWTPGTLAYVAEHPVPVRTERSAR